MKKLALLCVSIMMSGIMNAQTRELPRSTPEAEGIESAMISEFFDGLMGLPQTEIHSAMILRHGKVIAEMYPEPFAPEYRQTVFSASKTFTAAAIGIAIDENLLRVTDRAAAFFPELLPENIPDNLAEMTIRDLLMMSSGILMEQTVRVLEKDWLKAYFAKETCTPGEKFRYDSIATYTLSAIIQKVTGMTLLEYLKIKLFGPMNIRDVEWEISPDGITVGGWGIHIQSESLAKFGQLLLNRGVWNGERLISAEWIEDMMTDHIDTGSCGYGYQMWVEGPPGTARADGAYGQYVIVVPSKDMVFVITELTTLIGNGGEQKKMVWNFLPKVGDGVLPPSKDYDVLVKKMGSYALPKMEGKATSSTAKLYNGRAFKLEDNSWGWETISFNFGKNIVTAHIREKGGKEYSVVFGHKNWEKCILGTKPPYPLINAVGLFDGITCPFWAAGNYAWPSKNQLRMKIYYVNWMSSVELNVRFEDEGISLTVTQMFDQHTTVKGR